MPARRPGELVLKISKLLMADENQVDYLIVVVEIFLAFVVVRVTKSTFFGNPLLTFYAVR